MSKYVLIRDYDDRCDGIFRGERLELLEGIYDSYEEALGAGKGMLNVRRSRGEIIYVMELAGKLYGFCKL